MRVAPAIFVSTHAKKQAETRAIPKSTFWAADREVRRTGLKVKMITQHQKLLPILTDKKILLRVDDRLCKVSKFEMTTRLILDGITYALGIRRVGDEYSPLTCLTIWTA